MVGSALTWLSTSNLDVGLSSCSKNCTLIAGFLALWVARNPAYLENPLKQVCNCCQKHLSTNLDDHMPCLVGFGTLMLAKSFDIWKVIGWHFPFDLSTAAALSVFTWKVGPWILRMTRLMLWVRAALNVNIWTHGPATFEMLGSFL